MRTFVDCVAPLAEGSVDVSRVGGTGQAPHTGAGRGGQPGGCDQIGQGCLLRP